MKRCTKCNFIYLDSDEVCDLDGAPLVFENDSDVEATTIAVPQGEPVTVESPSPEAYVEADPGLSKGTSRKILVVAGIGSLILLLALLVGVYYSVIRRDRQKPVVQETGAASGTQEPSTNPSPSAPASPSPSVEPSPAARPSPSPKTNLAKVAVNSNPVSTGSEQKGKSNASTIRLANGAKIEADEVWRTKEGIWYRRQGMVTLLKPNRVQAIERR